MTATPEIAYLYLKTDVSVDKGGRFELLEAADFSGRDVAHVITAWNPGAERPHAEVNEAANLRLRDDLVSRGATVVRARGSDPSSPHYEDSWLVHGLQDKQARSIGAEYGQVGIFSLANSRQTVLACFEEWAVSRSMVEVSNDDVVTGHNAFNAGGLRTWLWFVQQLPEGPDLLQHEHRRLLLKFLNRWGCRLEYGQSGEPSVSEVSLESWWRDWSHAVEITSQRPLELLSASELDAVADAYWDLRCRPASTNRNRQIGPTAASKVMLALSPGAIPAWDATIARKLYGGTTRDNYWSHLASAAKWSVRLRETNEISRLLSEGASHRIGMGKLLDQALYRAYVRTS